MFKGHETAKKKEFNEQWRESKKKDGHEATASPNAISKLVADVIPASVNPLDNQFDDEFVDLAASAVNKSVTDDTDEHGPSVQCSMPSASSSQDRKRTEKRKKNVKDSVFRVSKFAICNYFQLSSILYIYFLTICKINNLEYISLNSARVPCEQKDQKGEDPFLTLARKKHEAKTRILQLKEWKIKNECMQMEIGLPLHVSQENKDVYH